MPDTRQSVRVQGLPLDSTEKDVKDFFDRNLAQSIEGCVQRVCPLQKGTSKEWNETVVTFWASSTVRRAKDLSGTAFQSTSDKSEITVDERFLGFTILYWTSAQNTTNLE